jgi:hypothetical protein
MVEFVDGTDDTTELALEMAALSVGPPGTMWLITATPVFMATSAERAKTSPNSLFGVCRGMVGVMDIDAIRLLLSMKGLLVELPPEASSVVVPTRSS